jgi:hypothetical protein
MSEIQVLDGMLDTSLHDEQGRKHGVFRLVGDPYNWNKGNWTLLVEYVRGVQQFPVKWESPSGRIERRSRSYWVDEKGLVGPDGWTRYYSTNPDAILEEGFAGPSTPAEHIYYNKDGTEVLYHKRWTAKQTRKRKTEPPSPNKWPKVWPAESVKKPRHPRYIEISESNNVTPTDVIYK